MNKRRVTITLDAETVRKAKTIAAKRSMSLSALVEERLAGLSSEEESYEAAKRRALKLLRRGFRMGGKITATRDELHER